MASQEEGRQGGAGERSALRASKSWLEHVALTGRTSYAHGWQVLAGVRCTHRAGKFGRHVSRLQGWQVTHRAGTSWPAHVAPSELAGLGWNSKSRHEYAAPSWSTDPAQGWQALASVLCTHRAGKSWSIDVTLAGLASHAQGRQILAGARRALRASKSRHEPVVLAVLTCYA